MNQPPATQPLVTWTDPNEPAEVLFRRTMARATDQAWNLGVDDEALFAMYGVLNKGARRWQVSERLGDALSQ